MISSNEPSEIVNLCKTCEVTVGGWRLVLMVGLEKVRGSMVD